MARKFQELLDKMTPESRARAEARAQAALKEMPLDELRAARELTQEHLAEILNVGQAAISKMERRSDMHISTLRQFVKAMGGQLEIRAVFPDGEVRISQFKDLR
jgi:DNA-binding transcriptional regulator YiaG